ncbi:DUF4139 domain-containing protein [Alistipes sp.]|uniref:DUF4139 domain-containing protein n=1 Tax=Alistipes sp. TaxID=1872444 RepID=UPI0025C2C1C7|nr:DUF4139 domain-containing protein [Alistipes sp.]MCI7140179.1 DUF4139 domain-containing protein [Alistipes sp.]MDY5396410.1 DUF4139 domain-containing protein [Alistipes sp.]
MSKKCLFLLLGLYIATAVPVLGQTKVKTAVEKVTLFIDGAQVTRSRQVNIPAGRSVIVFTGLSSYLDDRSMQIAARGNFTITAVNRRFNYTDSLERSNRQKTLEKRLDEVLQQQKQQKALLEVINAENEMLKANCSISNRNVATPLAAIKELNEYYTSRMQEIKRRTIRTEELIDTLNMREKQYFAELAQLNSRQKAPMSEVEVRIDAPAACKGAFTLTYYVQNAGWYPSYDIRSDGLSKPVEIAYKANVFQNTGEEWPDVALTLSSSNPTTGSIAPELQTWWLDFGTTSPLYDLTPTNNTVTGTVYGKNYRPLSDVIVKVAGTTIGTSTDARGRFSITVPDDAKDLQFDFAGYQTQTKAIGDSPLHVHMEEEESDLPELFIASAKYTTTVAFTGFDETTDEAETSKAPQVERTQTLLGYEFAISQPYTIASDGKVLTVEIGRFDLPARYTYHATPKIDKDAFLVAETTDWEKLNLMEGEANIYFENTFVGKSILSPRETGDTLRFSMGRDRGIRIERTRENDYSKQRTLGSNRTQTVGWKFTLRNTRTEPVELVLTDQLPISRNNSITITEEKLDGGTIDPNSGIVTWHLDLKPGAQRDLRLRYAVKYPKNQELHIE